MANVNEMCTFKKKSRLSQRTRKRKSSSDEGIMLGDVVVSRSRRSAVTVSRVKDRVMVGVPLLRT